MIRWIAAALFFGGCAQTVSIIPVTTTQRSVMTIVRLALENDAADVTSDSLYSASATIVINGSEHTTGKRFAGVGPAGFIRISSMSGDAMERLAWAYVAYRWMSPDGAMTQSARASFVLNLENGAWRIKHAHSSLILPWQRG